MEILNLPPYAPTLMESTRAIGYSLEAAVADIIDNSIAANAHRVDLYFFPVGGEYVAIMDDGIGMSDSELNIAMQYGSKNPNDQRQADDLGRFGLGLKTASLSQCRVLTVITKQGGTINARRWDLDYVAQSGEWSLLILDTAEMENVPHYSDLLQLDHGTLVVWQKLDRMKAGEINFEQALGKKMDAVREHIALVFHRYIAGETGINKLKIVMNGATVAAADPFLIKKSVQAMDNEILSIHGKKITVTPYILPHTSKLTSDEIKTLGGKEGLRRQQGFYVYRNKRLLVWGTWFRMMRQGEMSKLVRIKVDIPNALDDLWTLDIKKSSAIPPAEVRNNLRNIIDRMAERSKRTWTYRGKKETSDNITHMWNRLKTRQGGYIYEINREHPLIKAIIEKYPMQEGMIEILLQQIETEIPLNALYLDLTNDEKIENDKDKTVEEILDLVRNILRDTDKDKQREVINSIIFCEPFNECADDIITAFDRGKLI